jgi:hypothetical protein
MYPISDIKQLKPVQEEYNVGRAMILTHAKRYGRKYGYISEKFGGDDPDKEIEKLKDPQDGVLFKVNELPLSNVIEPLKDAPLDPAVYSNFEQTKQDFREVGGATEYERGLVERRKTAYEASRIFGASNVRQQDRRSLVEDFCSEIGTKLLQSMQANLTKSQAVEIVGEKGLEWRNISREEIAGEFTVETKVGSVAPAIPEFERQELNYFLQFLSQVPMEVLLPEINISGLIKEVCRLYPLLNESNILNSPEEKARVQNMSSLMGKEGKEK